MDLTRLRLLAKVAEHGSMTAAAEALNYTPSAVSQQIRRLETELGQPLVQRHPRGVELTDAGTAVVEHGVAIERQLEALQKRLDDISGLADGSLRMGSFPTAGSSLLPLAVTEFRRRAPGVALSVESVRLPQLQDLLERRRIELAILWDYAWSRIDDRGLHLRPIMEDPTAVVVASEHPLARRDSVDFADLSEEAWIIRGDEHPLAEVLTRAGRSAGFDPQVAFKANDYQELQAMVAVGLGIAIAPRLALTNLREDVCVISLGPAAPRRRILAARLRSRRPTPAEMMMEQILLEIGRAGHPGRLGCGGVPSR